MLDFSSYLTCVVELGVSKFETELQKLNPEQRQVVEAIQGPTLVIAGPGTGKTQMLSLRIANILRSTDTNPSNILCLTFTESGVAAMKKRLVDMIGPDGHYVRIHTFHSFCNEVIQTFPEKFAFARELNQLDDITRIKLMREILDAIPADAENGLRPFYNPYAYQFDIISAIQTLKREGVSPERFMQIADDNLNEVNSNEELNPKTGKPTVNWATSLKQAERNMELAQLYSQYQQLIQERGLYDYEDMVLFVVKLFSEDDELLAHYQERYLHILVDEYQDTNGAQNQIIQLLGSFDPSPNIFVVGDDDQAIYRFQGANVGNIMNFTQQFENVQTFTVTTNYRSSQAILDAASSLIKNNKQRLANLLPDISKELKSGLEIPKHDVEVYEFSNQDVENKFIVQRIQELHDAGVDYSDVAVLYRRHSDAGDVVDALLHAGVPLKISAGNDALNSNLVQQLVNFLKVIHYEAEERDKLLAQVMFYDFLQLDRLEVFKFVANKGVVRKDKVDNTEKKGPKPGSQLLLNPEVLNSGLGETVDAFLHKVISWKALDANLCIYDFLQEVATQSGFLDYVFNRGELSNIDDMNAVNAVFAFVRQINHGNRDAKLGDLISDLQLLAENKLSLQQNELELHKHSVNMLTAHAAKGLEFKHVFIIKFYEGNWGGRTVRKVIKLPSSVVSQSTKDNNPADNSATTSTIDSDLEDERRLLFVAMTRAKEFLYLSYARKYGADKQAKEVTASQFLDEISQSVLAKPDTAKFEEFDSSFAYSQLTPIVQWNYTETEKEYLRQLVSEFKLSASSLNEYIECPLKFKFNRLLKIPKAVDKNLALGTAVHFALEHLMRSLMKGVERDKSYILFLIEEELRRQVLSEDDRAQTINVAQKLVGEYYDHYQGQFEVPIDVEYGFYGRHLQLTQAPGNDGQMLEPVPLTGKLDKISWLDKSTYSVKVTDYKTMSPKSANEIQGKTKSSEGNIYRQLVFYKLLAQVDDRFRPNPAAPKYTVDQVEVDFIKPNERGIFKKEVFEIPQADVEELKEKIFDVMSHIRDLDFGGGAEYPLCGECEYCQMLAAK